MKYRLDAHPYDPCRLADANVPGKNIKGVLVEYGPGGYSPGRTHAKSAFIFATVLEGPVRSQVNGGSVTGYKNGQSFAELPGDHHNVSANAKRERAGQALGSVRGGHEGDGTDDPLRKLRPDAFHAGGPRGGPAGRTGHQTGSTWGNRIWPRRLLAYTIAYSEKVRPQFLSLRQPALGRRTS